MSILKKNLNSTHSPKEGLSIFLIGGGGHMFVGVAAIFIRKDGEAETLSYSTV
jgi:hypothetical protein